MTGILLPALAALERYFPDHGRIDAMPAALAPGNAKALVIEGDLVIDRNGLIQTDDLLPEVTAQLRGGDVLVAIVVTGNLTAPNVVLIEPDIDWSPRFKVGGNLEVRSLCLGGSVSLIDGDLIVTDTLFGHYNHGWLSRGLRAAEKPGKVMRAAALADRILAFLPKTPALCWLLHQRDLGLLRLACLLAQAERFLHQATPDPRAALALLDTAQAEVDTWMDPTINMARASWIGALRARA